ncbi:lytic murein transglycosylase [Nocardioides jejuensis]|uniref:lytic transglycosylase domain-containing protein n=1 Tax=Nocardioides jejuensis TaxID=2502782 RepID=UPI001A9F9BFA|nr:lytic murein transglycosylase [Nocardioides jejuensis]
MSAPRFGKIQKVTALVPLALLSTAWTANLAGVGGLASASDQLPDGTQLPIEALEDPASYTAPGQVGLGITAGDGAQIVATASTNGIPTAALAAYQRAEQVINDADKACHIDWALIAAIGRVESDHGRYGGNTLDTKGVSHPGIYGPALDGTKNTQAVPDTDGGLYDNDKVWDRAVGAMQFIPSTWAKVGVDADGDGKRNPQDIDDAALATAVYLCSGTDDLGTEGGRRTSVFRYNHSQDYVDLVLKIRDAYLAGNYTAVPNYITSAYTFSPPSSWAPIGGGYSTGHGHGKGGGVMPDPDGNGSTGGGDNGGTTTPPGGDDGGTTTPPPGGGDNGGGTPKPDPTKVTQPIKNIIEGTTKTVTDITKTAAYIAANATCTTQATLFTPLKSDDIHSKWVECMTNAGYTVS